MYEVSIIERTKGFFKESIEVIKNGDILVKECIKNKFPLADIAITFRDEYLIRKMYRFFSNISETSFEERNKIIKKLQNEKIIESIIIAIDRIDLEDKVDYYSKLIILLCREEIDVNLFHRCCKILENYSYDDVSNFSRKESYNIVDGDDVIAFSMGLLQNKPQGKGTPISALGLTELVLSKAGEIFLKLNNM